MPLQNRVLPTGEIVALAERGLFTGNRGILHRANGTLGPSRWKHKHWLCCALKHPRGTYHGPMPERGWSALFFMDEAVALAAGHRPCHYCRRADFLEFQAAWTETFGPARAPQIDDVLQPARVRRNRSQVRHDADLKSLPHGSFCLSHGVPTLVADRRIWPWTPGGYGPPKLLHPGTVPVLTPKPIIAALRAGYRPHLHPSATD